MSKRNVYLFAIIAVVAGYLWVLFNQLNPFGAQTPNLCLFKRVTGIPCPSCGCTHSVVKLLHLDWAGAIQDNPLGIVLALVLMTLPLWLLFDLASKKNTFYNFYNKAEVTVKKQWVAIPLIVLLVVNWAWSIYKYKT